MDDNDPTPWSEIFTHADPQETRRRFRVTLEDTNRWPIVLPAVHDFLSARVAEQAGFQTVILSGYGVSISKLGLPDAGLLGLADVSAVVRTIAQRTSLAIIADCDTGYGNALNAIRTAEEMIDAGAAAFFIEDQVMPKKSGHRDGKAIVSIEEFEKKLQAIGRVRRELAPDLVVVARSDVRGAPGATIADVIERGIRYLEAGADVFFPEGLRSHDELVDCAEALKAPLIHNMANGGPVASNDELARLGVALAIPGEGLSHAIRGMTSAYVKMFRGESVVAGFDVHAFCGFDEVDRLEAEFLVGPE